MANPEHLEILRQGVDVWNAWRKDNPSNVPDLSGAELEKMELRNADLRGADFTESDLSGVDLNSAVLEQANFQKANLFNVIFCFSDLRTTKLKDAFLIATHFSQVNLSGVDFSGVNLTGADFILCDLSDANLAGADLSQVRFMAANLNRANLNGCRVFGISAWRLELEETRQTNLVITGTDEPVITVDHIEVAQFMYLLLRNANVRRIVDTITAKVVLILGRFTEQRKVILDALREALRERDLLPVLFDFDKPSSRDITETVSTLAHMARFVIADITDAKSIPQELMAIIPNLPSVPVQPLLQISDHEYD